MTTDPKDAGIARLTARAEKAEAALSISMQNQRDTWAAMSSMRDTINEHIPMPSLESDLLQGPENSVFCATVAQAVVAALTESHSREAALHHAITEASGPDFIWGAMDNVNDMGTTLDDFAKAASRAIRAAIPDPSALSRRDAQMRAEGRKEGLREAAALCDDTAQEALEESGAESRAIWTWFRGQRDAILAAAEREASP